MERAFQHELSKLECPGEERGTVEPTDAGLEPEERRNPRSQKQWQNINL
jgi:hypothetical protein